MPSMPPLVDRVGPRYQEGPLPGAPRLGDASVYPQLGLHAKFCITNLRETI